MNFRIRHETRYQYETPVVRCYNEARLAPSTTQQQLCSGSELHVEPAAAEIAQHWDFFGNSVSYFSIHTPHDALTVTATSQVQVAPYMPTLDFAAELPWELASEQTRADFSAAFVEARQYALDSPMVATGADLRAYAAPSFAPHRPVLDAVSELMARIHEDFAYDPDFTTIATPLETVLAHRRGVCQDFAHLAIGCLRSLGLAARYVSGYIETDPAPGASKMIGADASHAWFSLFVPSRGWVDFDPTNNQMPWDRHITVASGRDYSDVPPLKGVLVGGGSHELSVSVTVLREEL